MYHLSACLTYFHISPAWGDTIIMPTSCARVINEPKTYQQPLETQSEQDRPVRASNLFSPKYLRGRWTVKWYVQLIADEIQWCYEPDARDEADNFGDQCVESAEDEQAAEYRRTNVTAAEDRGWVAALYDSMTTHREIYMYNTVRQSVMST